MVERLRLALANIGRRLVEAFGGDGGYGETLIDSIKREWL